VGGWLGDQELLAVVGSSCSPLVGRLMLPNKSSDHFLWQLLSICDCYEARNAEGVDN
jgi:hypothetical protein